ncbi:SDR family NAD(P)-dependent oxidoreductase [Solwaraspora sp. WMMB335]|uniref:SDR family NAD(P)-dependent oxidoreductase n=1 Tax=Solwaraspora sp. WMMB335 TaxID=3404118 RepID=UPI003B9287BE
MSERTVLVTGSTGGLGPTVVDAFATGGWRVVSTSRTAGTGTVAATGTTAIRADLTDPDQVNEVVATATADPAAPLRAVVNLVGGYRGTGAIHETPIDDFEQMMRINLRPTYLTTRAALPHLVEAGGGSVVCVSSRAALVPFAGAAGYVTAKAAVLAFAAAVAVEYRAAGVRCNTVVPAMIDTPANRRSQPDADHANWVRPAEIAPVIVFLAGPQSAPTSGAVVPVYG